MDVRDHFRIYRRVIAALYGMMDAQAAQIFKSRRAFMTYCGCRMDGNEDVLLQHLGRKNAQNCERMLGYLNKFCRTCKTCPGELVKFCIVQKNNKYT